MFADVRLLGFHPPIDLLVKAANFVKMVNNIFNKK
jgi:hypothetical protein